MNRIQLRGVLKNIEHSHDIGNISFDKAVLIVPRETGQEDMINLRFKSFSNRYKDGDNISITGNVRSYSYRINEEKNRVVVYVFTYFDYPEVEQSCGNIASLDGRICKLGGLRKNKRSKSNVHFIVANNLVTDAGKRLNSYIPCIAWGTLAEEISNLSVNTKIRLQGELRSREHKKVHENGEIEFRVAHEFLVTEYEVVE